MASLCAGAMLSLLVLVRLPSCSDAENLEGIMNLCRREPHLTMCLNRGRQIHVLREVEGSSLSGRRQLLERLEHSDDEGLVPVQGGGRRYGPPQYSNGRGDPYRSLYRKGYYYPNPRQSYYPRQGSSQVRTYPFGSIYHLYPGLYPKTERYCPDMRGMFAWTCQPSKPLRLDHVEFCKVPNYHRLPGPRMGHNGGKSDIGHVDVGYNFGFSIGVVPGLEVNAGWDVDVGPIPGMGESVGVGLGNNVAVVGAKPPKAYRRGMDDPNQKGGGIVGVGGGVNVNPGAGVGPIGVSDGVGVGK